MVESWNLTPITGMVVGGGYWGGGGGSIGGGGGWGELVGSFNFPKI